MLTEWKSHPSHKALKEEVKGGHSWTPIVSTITQVAAYSRMLSPHSGCVVALHHVETQQLVYLHVIGILIKTAACHSR